MDHAISSYEYAPLDPDSHAIRLVTILPGQPDDRIELEITHTVLPPVDAEPVTHKDSLVEIQRHLPRGWLALKTAQGRMLFHKRSDDGIDRSQWDHPDPSFRSESGNSTEQIPDSSYRPEYEALSYVWGSPEPYEYAYVMSKDASNKVGSLGLGTNLSLAVRRLRDSQKLRVMWIDAICINQEDVMERNEQVKRMGVIYRKALRVVVWLGPTSPDVDLAFKLICLAGQRIEILASGGVFPAPGYTMRADEGLAEMDLQSDTATWMAIFSVISLPWFTRLWVVQEIWLASPESVLICGKAEIQWKLFRNGITTLAYNKYSPGDYVARLSTSHAHAFCAAPTNKTFEELLMQYAAYQDCDHHHDRIYGLLGVMPHTIATAIRDTIDYNKPFEKVYKEIFFLRANQSRRLDLLQYCIGTDHLPLPIPDYWVTWEPNWTTWVPNWCIKKRYNVGLQHATAAGFSPSEFQYIEPGLLRVPAVVITTISTIENTQVNTFSDIVPYFRCVDLQSLQENLDHTGQALLDAYLHCFLRGDTAENRGVGWASFDDVKSYILASVGQPEGVVASEADVPRTHFIPLHQQRALNSRCPDSSFFTSADKVVGSGSLMMQPGDVVAVLLGCCAPLVLRPHGETYKVVDDCYVHGFMEGQALLGPLERQFHLQNLYYESGRRRAFVNTYTGACYLQDPRLRGIPLPSEWELAPHDDQARVHDDPEVFCRYRHRDTGELINYDPRVTADALRNRGVPVQTITLV
ncbi:heterokaryon incompatibility protein-domain-containing protein [Xylaria arbuscula]|nr:heterokaryon incompatibility protein-domain-containing protein [Xylaria arbuscula]